SCGPGGLQRQCLRCPLLPWLSPSARLEWEAGSRAPGGEFATRNFERTGRRRTSTPRIQRAYRTQSNNPNPNNPNPYKPNLNKPNLNKPNPYKPNLNKPNL